jgi:hypothetical protein
MREYEKDWILYPHKWKDDLSKLGKMRGWDIVYNDLPLDSEIPYIQIYKTSRDTTHAVVKQNGNILFNPYWIEDLVETTGSIHLSKQ